MKRKLLAFMLFLLFILVAPQEIRLASVLAGGTWEDVFQQGGGFLGERGGPTSGGGCWKATSGCGSGGEVYELHITDRQGRVFVWDTCFDLGSFVFKVDRSAQDPRFLVYQPILDGNSNHHFCGNPQLLHAGIYLIQETPDGFERQPLVTSPVNLVARNPISLLFLADKLWYQLVGRP